MLTTALKKLLISSGIISLLIFGKKYFSGRKCPHNPDLSGKVILITGGDSGMGLEAAKRFARLNATLVLACYPSDRTEPVIQALKEESKNKNIFSMKIDLGSFASVQNFAKEFNEKFSRLDVLLSNAGALFYTREESVDGVEKTFQINYLSAFLLVHLLLEKLKATKQSRVIFASSMANNMVMKLDWEDLETKKNYIDIKSYSKSKLALVMFAKELTRRLKGFDMKFVSIHPGVVRTALSKKSLTDDWFRAGIVYLSMPLVLYMTKTPEEGAQTAIDCALRNYEDLRGGEYYENLRISKPSKFVTEENCKKMWEVSIEMIKKRVPGFASV